MIVHVSNDQDVLPINLNRVEQIVKQVIKEERQQCDEVSIYFVTTEKICELHEQFFNDPSTTDCISFPIDDSLDIDYRLLGEVCICPETAVEYGQKHKVDPYEETTLYIVHGLLHLMGYRDLEEDDIKLMREAEIRHMNQLKKLNLYLSPMV